MTHHAADRFSSAVFLRNHTGAVARQPVNQSASDEVVHQPVIQLVYEELVRQPVNQSVSENFVASLTISF
eukprot:CAMPEP_0185747682 /NCGR_PEP_ID=MMETSP1174-20130828/6315_1 /TAXON_ID=35687 /ORGANISM="Dictyocha speculum, Strain CCMP1381" /LENGTH=69 /DNA_ID=CAMNT_0028422967 /DNA_START=274 /DNA_END=483 /DNA_ORIENTATION=+